MLATEAITMRSRQQLLEQVREIESFLTGGVADEDAEATTSPGWRPRDWRPDPDDCEHDVCLATHDHSPHPISHRPWQGEVDTRLDRWPRYLVLGVPRAINLLPLRDRLIVRGRTAMYWPGRRPGHDRASWVAVGKLAGVSDKTAKAHYEAALEVVACAVWNDAGEPRWCQD